MADNDGKILKALEALQTDVTGIKQSQAQTSGTVTRLEQSQANLATKQEIAQVYTSLDALKAGQDDIRENMATKADIHRLEQKIDRVAKDVKSHKSRIENLEEHIGTPNPHKN